jgi:hypothetical protein
MQIESNPLSAGVGLFQAGQQRLSQAAGEIAVATLPAMQPSQAVAEVSDQLIQLKLAEHEAALGAKMIRTADEVLGTLIDTRA